MIATPPDTFQRPCSTSDRTVPGRSGGGGLRTAVTCTPARPYGMERTGALHHPVSSSTPAAMIRNYLTVALRTLRKQPGYAFINIFGLGLGLAACLLILLYVQDELSYDRFHTRADRIYQIGLEGKIGGQHLNVANTATPMGPTMAETIPEVEAAVRVDGPANVLVGHGDRQFYEDAFYWADSTFFAVFDYAFLAGDPATALTAPNTVVLTRATARKYFGEADPLGQTLRYDNREDYTVTGVIEDVPSNTHFRFDLLASFVSLDLDPGWLSHHLYTYLLLREGATAEAVKAGFPGLIETYVAPEFEQMTGTPFQEAIAGGMVFGYYLQPLADLYLRPQGQDPIGPTGDIRYVYILGAVAVFILLLACINFMNLGTARSAGRAKEVGVRKVLGSDRRQLVRQFLGESVLTAGLAALVAAVLVAALLPLFNALAGKTLALTGANLLQMTGLLLGIALVCGLLAGVYPAFVLSAFRPVVVLKGQLGAGGRSARLRSTLVVMQFAVSIMLLVGTGVVFRQLSFMQNERLGFAGEQVVVLPLETREAHQRFDTFRQTLLQHPGVVDAAAADFVPGRVNNTTAFRPEEAPESETYVLAAVRATHDYRSTLGLTLVEGRDFSRDMPTDATAAMIINEAAAREFGWTPREAVGRRVAEIGRASDDGIVTRTVIGVVKDFHFESMRQAIRPLMINIQSDWYGRVVVRVRPENLAETLAFVESQWRALEPGYPYQAVFLDDDFNRFYQQERRLSQVFLAFTLLAVLIACLGLFGLASFMAQRRTKEIGVRKALGASVPGIVLLLTKEFTKLVLIAAVLAVPVAYLAMQQWLQGFAYRAGISPLLLVAAAGPALVVSWLTVSYQSIRAAAVNPVEALRYE
jgi:putative ABC transport system permease protein